MKRYSVLTLAVLVAGLGLGRLHAEDDAGRLDRLEKSVEAMNERLNVVEDFLAGLREGMVRSKERALLAEETTRMKQVVQCLLAITDKDFPRLRDGTIDVYAIVRMGVVEDDTFVSLTKNRHGREGATIEELAKGKYEKFPYERGGRWCTNSRTRVAPVFWEKSADRHDRIVVAFNNGAVKVLERKELKRLIAELEKQK